MWFWWFLFVCDLIVPLIMIISGRIMWKHPPKSINGIVGYRTTRSMKNDDTWKFAHDYCGQLWWRVGWGLFLPSVLIHIPLYQQSETAIGIMSGILCTVQCAVLILPIVLTEHALKKNFTDEGIQK